MSTTDRLVALESIGKFPRGESFVTPTKLDRWSTHMKYLQLQALNLSKRETKVCLIIIHLVVVCGYINFITLFAWQAYQAGQGEELANEKLILMNLISSIFCFLLLMGMSVHFARQLRKALRSNYAWTSRLKRGVSIQVVGWLSQCISATCFMCVNVILFIYPCWWLPGSRTRTVYAVLAAVRWTAWNVMFGLLVIEVRELFPLPSKKQHELKGNIRKWAQGMPLPWGKDGDVEKPKEQEARLVMDGSFWRHLPLLLVWMAAETFLILNSLTVVTAVRSADAYPADIAWTVEEMTADQDQVISQLTFVFTDTTYDTWAPFWTNQSSIEYLYNAKQAVMDGWMATLKPFCSGELSISGVVDVGQSLEDTFRHQVGLPNCHVTDSCIPWLPYMCTEPSDALRSAMTGVLGTTVIYYLIFLWYLVAGRRALRRRPYQKFRDANVLLRLQGRLNGVAYFFWTMTLVVALVTSVTFCDMKVKSLFTLYGFAPVEFVAVCLMCIKLYLASPEVPQPNHLYRAQLQTFSWTEADKDDIIDERGHTSEPMFCYETALKMYFWTRVAYKHKKHKGSNWNIAHSLELYGMESFEVIEQHSSDSYVIAAWRPGLIVLAFRGTYSGKNAMIDIKAWLAPHPDVVNEAGQSVVCMHKGFWTSWMSIKSDVMNLVNRLLRADEMEANNTKIMLTGHSLGGALATLAAFDIAQERPASASGVSLVCYTFGAPRVGTHAFAKVYLKAVPDTWDITNDQDIVPKATKWLFVYKRTGRRVIINKLGDIIVRPSWIELNVQQAGRSSVKDHRLPSYERALAAVVKAQFSKKKEMEMGRESMIRLWNDDMMKKMLLECLNVDLDPLIAANPNDEYDTDDSFISATSHLLHPARSFHEAVDRGAPVRSTPSRSGAQAAPRRRMGILEEAVDNDEGDEDDLGGELALVARFYSALELRIV